MTAESLRSLPASLAPILESKAFTYLSTTMSDGSSQVYPVWFEVKEDHVFINSAQGRLKDRNMRARPKVGLAMANPENPYNYIGIRGTVVEITEEGADAHIDSLAKKYLGVDEYPHRREGEVRVIYKIRPDNIFAMG